MDYRRKQPICFDTRGRLSYLRCNAADLQPPPGLKIRKIRQVIRPVQQLEAQASVPHVRQSAPRGFCLLPWP
jgi:hypothetical protein